MNQADLRALLEYDFPTAIHALDHHATVTPEKDAVYYGDDDRTVTYAEFARITDLVAGNLASLGIDEGDRVSIMSRNALASGIVMYGAWKAAAVYAPVNYLYTADLLAYQLGDTQPGVFIVDEELRPVVDRAMEISGHDCTVLSLTESGLASDEGQLLREASRPDRTIDFSSPANVIFTSGTTGRSKGVLQSHRWVNGYSWILRKMITPEDVVYSDLPMYHVAGAHSNFARALWAGASISLWDKFSPNDFWRRIEKSSATTAVLLDVMITWLRNAEPSPKDRWNTLNKVHLMPLPADHNAFARRFSIDFVTVGFGQSETGSSLYALIDELDDSAGTPAELYRGHSRADLVELFKDHGALVVQGDADIPKGLMGAPLPFTEMSVFTSQDSPSPAGEVGELVMRPRLPHMIYDGYLARPEATVESNRNFWFHSGDAAYRDEEGNFFYVDRLGDRLRVRGENISGFHIEEILSKHPGVSLAAVVGVTDVQEETAEDIIVAFVELASTDVSVDQLHAYCEEAMPKFMRPREIVVVDAIPRTPTNKIEKYKLRNHYTESRTEEPSLR